MANTAQIDVVIGSSQAQSGANAVKNAVDGIKGSFLDLSAKVFVAEQALSQVWAQAAKGAQFEETMSRLNRQMAAVNSTGQLMVGTMQSITNNTLSTANAATMASRALAIGLDPQQIETFTKAASVLKDQMQTDLPTAFDQLTQAAITGHGAILANMGIFVDLDKEVRQLAVSTGVTTEQITRQQKAMLTANAIIKQTGDASHKLSDGMISDSQRLEEVETQWKNMWTGIQQDTKTAVIDSLNWIVKLKQGISDSISPDVMAKWSDLKKAFNSLIDPQGQALADQFPQDDAVWQGVFARAVTQDSLGNQARNKADAAALANKPAPQLPTSIRGSQLQDQTQRSDQAIQDNLANIKAGLQAAEQLYANDAQRQLVTQEELTNAKGVFRLRDLAATGQSLNQELQLENASYAQRVKIGFDSTEEKISEEQRHKDAVFNFNQAITANAQEFGRASVNADESNDLAKAVSQEQLGARLVASFQSTYAIEQSLRKQSLEGAQIYYQGQNDMANALYLGDQVIATNERALLRDELAYKLKLTTDQVSQMLYLRKISTVPFDDASEGASSILSGADPNLSPMAREGIAASATAKDIQLAERASGDFFAGWARGWQQYTQQRNDAFGMSVFMARQVSQQMDQDFQQFFFDGMSGKFQSFKDLLTEVLNFSKQIVSQIMAQFVTVGIVNKAVGSMANAFSTSSGSAPGAKDFSGTNFFVERNGGILPATRYASGGITSQPQLALFGEGSQPEAFVPLPDGKTIPVTMNVPRGNSSSAGTSVNVPIDIQIINQVSGAQVQTQRQTGADGKQQIKILVLQQMKAAFASGSMDKSMQRLGVTPQPVGR